MANFEKFPICIPMQNLNPNEQAVGDNIYDPERRAIKNELGEEIELAIDKLPNVRWRQIIRELYGVNGNPRTQGELADEAGVGAKAISYIKLKALRTLRQPHISSHLRVFLDESERTGIQDKRRSYEAWKADNGFLHLDTLWDNFKKSYSKDENLSLLESLYQIRSFGLLVVNPLLEQGAKSITQESGWTSKNEEALALFERREASLKDNQEAAVLKWKNEFVLAYSTGNKLPVFNKPTQAQQAYIGFIREELSLPGVRNSIAILDLMPNTYVALATMHIRFYHSAKLPYFDFYSIEGLKRAHKKGILGGFDNEVRLALIRYKREEIKRHDARAENLKKYVKDDA